MENSSGISCREDEEMELPPGFRFHPTDEELITHYLSQKVLNSGFSAIAIGEADLNKVEPWDLPSKAKMGEKEWYFFCVRDRKYPTGMRTNRATEAGYWKATGKDKEIMRAKTLVGMKKTLVFYTGRAPKGEKTNWVMHEYRLEGKFSKSNLPKTAQNEWVICRVFEKSSGSKNPNDVPGFVSLDELQPPFLPPLMDSSSPCDHNNETKVMVANPPHVTCFSSQDLVGEDQKKPTTITTTTTTLTETPTQEDNRAMMNPLMEENTADFEYMDSVFMQDQSILKLLLEERGSSKVEFSEMNNDMSSMLNYEMVQNSDGPIDLDWPWGY